VKKAKIVALPVLLLALVAVLGFLVLPRAARADENVNAKLRALFGQFDANRNHVLELSEQAAAVADVRTRYGAGWAQQVAALFKAAAAPDGSVSAMRWEQQVAAFGQSAAAAMPTQHVAMRDGVKLATDVYLPQGTGPFPVILARTPYARGNRGNAEGFNRAGMVFVVQSMRGRFDSEGENLPFIGCGWSQHQDGVDTLAWLRRQPWCNGRIATIGGSAGGITQNLLAGAAPEGLTAQYLSVAAANMYTDAAYIGGAFRKADLDNWLTQNKFDPGALDLMHAHASYDDYWRQFDTGLKFAVMNVPAVHCGGWFDMFAQGTLDEFVGRQHQGAAGSRGTQKLIMGPWVHALGHMPVGELRFPGSQAPAPYDSGRWLEHYLQGVDNGVEKEPAVTYYVMGDTRTAGAPGNVWRQADDWPIPATPTPFYFSAAGTLSPEKPGADRPAAVEYTFDPAHPCPTIGGNNLTIARGPMNQNCIESRKDVVLFTTAPLAAPLEVTGRVRAKVFIASSAADTDVSVRLCDVYPDGQSYLIAEGMLRLRYRKSFAQPERLTPGKIEEVCVDCWSTSIIFNQGHRLRATVTSSNYPRFDINPGTGNWGTDAGPPVRQTNHIYCSGAQASCLLLPRPGR